MIKLPFGASFLPSLYNGLDRNGDGKPEFSSLYDLPIVVANIIQILLAVIAALAVIYIMYAGILYITSNGDPQKTAAAKTAIQNAIIGLVLSSSAYLILFFLARNF